ncbi:hypothetical protein EXIGLDRAFT_355267 [Exidia glandulosa HHB12029]|uniref:Transmembrane protein n=1 Tax=Exidia glandulosa HHB12029 TaxID=1314781 RepID=A0A165CAY3_EXIGL|nr:hypothetical protein EXIGLDRAFT_355267 [Exidia glandulosa HHB12029]
MNGLVSLVSVCVECILYGIALAQFVLSLCLLARRRSASKETTSHRVSRPQIFVPLIVLFFICTAHLAVAISCVHASPPASALEGAKVALYTVANAVADGLLIWRLWAIWKWQRVLIVAGPIVLLVCTTICGFGTAARLNQGWTTAFISSALLTKLSVTCFVAAWLRSLDVGREFVGREFVRRELLPPVLRVLLTGSGVSYALPLAALLALHLAGEQSAANVLFDALPQLTLLLPALGVVHGAFEAARDNDSSTLETCHHNTFADRDARRRDGAISPSSFVQPPPSPQPGQMPPSYPIATDDMFPPSSLTLYTDLKKPAPAVCKYNHGARTGSSFCLSSQCSSPLNTPDSVASSHDFETLTLKRHSSIV